MRKILLFIAILFSLSGIGQRVTDNNTLLTKSEVSGGVALTLTSHTWNGVVIGSTYGGTGINNAGRTLTISTNSGTISFGAASKTFTLNNTLTLSGTDGSTLNIGAGGTLGSNAYTSTAYVPQTTTVNGHALSANVTVTAVDIGATTVGNNIITLTNPGAIRYLKINADNTVTARTAAEMLSDIGAQASGSYLTASNNLSDVGNAATARNNILPSKTGNTLKYLRVNAGETDYELVTLAGGGDLVSTNNLSDVANAGTARTNLGLAIGTNVQAYDADLTTYAGITPSANIQTLLGSADFAAARSNLGLVINTNVAPATSGSSILKGNGSGGFSSATANTDYAVAGTTISPSQITADQDNYYPTGWDDAEIVRLDGDATMRAITSFTAPIAATKPQKKILVNVGSSPIYLPGEHPDGTAANRTVTSADIIIYPKQSYDLIYDGTSSRWRVVGENNVWVRRGLSYSISAGSITAADHGELAFAQTGTSAASVALASTTSLPAAYQMGTGTTAAGLASVYFGKSVNTMGAFGSGHIYAEALVSIPTLSDGTETHTDYLLITNSPNGTTAEPNNSVFLRYSNGINSGKWQLVSQDNAGTESTADCGVTVAASTLYLLRIEIDKARSEARAYIDGAMVARVTGNMPNAVVAGAKATIVKSAGTTARTYNVHSFSAGILY